MKKISSVFRSLFGGASFYMILLVCVAIIGISCYIIYRNMAPADITHPVSDALTLPETETPAPLRSAAPKVRQNDAPAAAPVSTIADTPVAAPVSTAVVSPLSGRTLLPFSIDALTYNATMDDWRTHSGIDIASTAGTPVVSATAGTVSAVTDDYWLGTMVLVERSDGYTLTYANLQSKPPVKAGDILSPGDVLGAVGSTALLEQSESPHLHFAVTKDGLPQDPSDFLGKTS